MSTKAFYILSRVIQMIQVAALVVLMNFCLLKLAPGDIVDVMAGDACSATP